MLVRRYHKIIYIMIMLFLSIILYSCKSPSQIKNKSPVIPANTTTSSANKTITKRTTVKNNATQVTTNSTLSKKHILKTNSTISKNVTLSSKVSLTTTSSVTKPLNKSKVSINSSKTIKSKTINKAVSIINTGTNHITTKKLSAANIIHELNKIQSYKKQSSKEKVNKKINKSLKEEKPLRKSKELNKKSNVVFHKRINKKKYIISKLEKSKSRIKSIKKELNEKKSKKIINKRIEKVKPKRHLLIAKTNIRYNHSISKYKEGIPINNKEKREYRKREPKYKKRREIYHRTKKQKNNLEKSKKIVNNKKTTKLAKKIKRDKITHKINNAAEVKSKITKKQKTTVNVQSNNPNNGHEYIIGPGDVLDIEVWKEPQLSAKVPVRPDGKITLPLINDIQAAGRTPLELRAAIQKALSKYLENPVVSVSVLGVNKKFFILGKVNAPGEYPLNSPITVLQAIALAKGFADWADTQHIIILRQLHGRQIRLKFNYDAVAQGRDLNENIYLKPGDTIIVP